MPRKSTKRPTSVTSPPERPKPQRVAFGAALARIVLVALLATVASVWALVRHFSHPFQSMLVPAEPSASEVEITFDPPGASANAAPPPSR